MDNRAALLFAKDYLSAYYKSHACSIRDVITSQWTRGMVDGRTEAINILQEAIEKETNTRTQ